MFRTPAEISLPCMTTHRARAKMQSTAVDPAVHARRWKTLGVLALSLVIIGLDNTILNVALPTLQEEFDASSSTLQWMVDSGSPSTIRAGGPPATTGSS
jgi:hypothetical protein